MGRKVKNNKSYLLITILLFFALLLLVYVYLNAQYSFFSHDYTPLVFVITGGLVFLSIVLALMRYIVGKHLSDDSHYNYGDTESLQVILNNATTSSENNSLDSNGTKDAVPIVKDIADTTLSENNITDSDSIDFNQLEEDLLTATKMEILFESAGLWLFQNIKASYIAFSNITANEKLSIEYYKEDIPCETFLVEAVAERTDSIGIKNTLIHGGHTISVPFYKKGEIFGFVFIGSTADNTVELILENRALSPFIRILSTACLVIELAKTKEQRTSLQKAFSSYVPSAIVDLFEHDPSVLRIGGEYENLTIMFTDLREFTSLSETMAPDNLIAVLNEYFSEMSGVIEAFGGTVSKLVGDGILAFFGPPDTVKNHAEKCCEAALTMKKYEEILNSKLMGSGRIKTPLYTRIGISTGKVILGNIGSEKRLDYTVMGPEVNLASRIEAANKNCNTSILISYETFLAVRNAFECRRAAFMKLKGFSKSVYLFELLDKIKTPAEEKMLLANDLADLLGVDATALLLGGSAVESEPSTNVIAPQNAIASDVDEELEELEEFEDADDLEELD